LKNGNIAHAATAAATNRDGDEEPELKCVGLGRMEASLISWRVHRQETNW